MSKEKYYKLIIYINAFVVGFIIMALEMAGSRFLTPYFGSSIFTWASIISMVLLSLAAGYFIGGYIAEKRNDPFVIGSIVFFSSILILLIPIYFNPLFKLIHNNIMNTNLGGFIGALLTLFPPLTLLGMYSPYSVKIGTKNTNKSGKISGNLYGISTLGSIVGTLGITFILVPRMGSKNIAVILSVITFLSSISLIYISVFKKQIKTSVFRKALLIIYIFIFLTFIILILYLNKYQTIKNENKNYIEVVESKYNTIIVSKKDSYMSLSFRKYSSKYTESKINLENEFELPLPYSRFMQLGLVYSEKYENILMLGLGAGTTTTYLNKYLKNANITGIELDEEVIELSKKYFNLQESPNYKILNDDGRIFLSRDNHEYDIIMLDAYKGGYIPFHLCTQEFYSLVKEHLTENGCVILNLHSNTNLFNPLYTTLLSVFDNVDLYSYPNNSNVVAIAYLGTKKDRISLIYKAKELQQEYNFYYDLIVLINLGVDPPDIKRDKILNDDFAPINYLNAIEGHNKN
ncbi:MAG: fused MFS/spermidine synthase [Bacteroidales bacterium]|jgi:spermidine synthase|nr:fused MFS/spermidine synthase [Bacteroidales bacterium]